MAKNFEGCGSRDSFEASGSGKQFVGFREALERATSVWNE